MGFGNACIPRQCNASRPCLLLEPVLCARIRVGGKGGGGRETRVNFMLSPAQHAHPTDEER